MSIWVFLVQAVWTSMIVPVAMRMLVLVVFLLRFLLFSFLMFLVTMSWVLFPSRIIPVITGWAPTWWLRPITPWSAVILRWLLPRSGPWPLMSSMTSGLWPRSRPTIPMSEPISVSVTWLGMPVLVTSPMPRGTWTRGSWSGRPSLVITSPTRAANHTQY